jgi:hypothetical protein
MIPILYTAEVRWFLRDELPEKVLTWFGGGRWGNEPAPEREDVYLMFPGCESAGVKRREGRFEIKVIRDAPESVHYAPIVNGRSDSWAKWSYGKEGVAAWLGLLELEQAGWLAVKKTRWQRKISLDGSEPEEVDPMTFPGRGCNVELTSLRIEGGNWWTIGLEAYGAAESVRDHLHQVAVYFFSRHGSPLPLDATCSYSYPVWLNAIA